MKRSLVKILSLLLISAGVLLTLYVILPILEYEIFSSPKLAKREFISPIAQNKVQGAQTQNTDLTRASNWFVGAPDLPDDEQKIQYYQVSIPKLKIKDAQVQIAGDDLAKSLIHYKGTGIPGRPGNATIFGHSTLPQLYNPKNYLSIFTFLSDLKMGDKVFVDYDGIKYTYRVVEMFEVKPQEVYILEQGQKSPYITLVTCVPPGTYLKRLVVRAKL